MDFREFRKGQLGVFRIYSNRVFMDSWTDCFECRLERI